MDLPGHGLLSCNAFNIDIVLFDGRKSKCLIQKMNVYKKFAYDGDRIFESPNLD
jgi:hypothetical protein